MDDLTKIALIAVLTAGFIGCGAAESPSGAAVAQTVEAPPPDGSASPATTQHANSPDSVVGQFLQAVRGGDENQVSNLLTDVAREELAKSGWEVQPPGTPSSSYQVGRTEILPDGNGAYVNSSWIETLPSGENFSYEVVWVLRRQENGWKVAGMATEAVPGEDPVFFSFEHPQDMQRKKEAADAALVARQPPRQALQAPTDQQEPQTNNPPQTKSQ